MKSTRIVGLSALFAATCAVCLPALAQNVLGRLESEIRQGNGDPSPPSAIPAAPATPAAAPAAPKVYLGAVALDEQGGGVRITSVRPGGPAHKAGLITQDLVVGAAGKPIQLLSELTETLGSMKPGDRLALEVARGTKRMRISVVLGNPPGGFLPGDRTTPPPPTGLGAGTTEAIPPPPSDLNVARKEMVPPLPADLNAGRNEAIPAPPSGLPLPSPADGPALSVPAAPAAANNQQSQIADLRNRIEVLEHRVQELEKALVEAKKK